MSTISTQRERTRELLPRPEPLRARWAIVLLVGLVTAAYINSFQGVFLFDDYYAIEANERIRHLWPIWQVIDAPPTTLIHRPVISVTVAINYALGELDPWGYHAANLAIHLIATLALFGIIRRTLMLGSMAGRWGGAALPLATVAALAWAVHPLQTQAVTYVIQRAESMMGMFYLLTLYCAIRGYGSRVRRRWFGAAIVFAGLGMGSKEVMVTAPLVVVLYDRCFVSGSFRRAMVNHGWFYAGLAATWITMWPRLEQLGRRFVLQEEARVTEVPAWAAFPHVPPWQYLCSQAEVIPQYLRLAVWPAGQCFDYQWPVASGLAAVWPWAAVVTAMAVATLWMLWRRPAAGFLGAWFFLILAPSSSIISLPDRIVEHRMYLPLAAVVAGVVLGAWWAMQRWSGTGRRDEASWRRTLPWVAAAATVVVLMTLTIQRNALYHSQVAMWGDVVETRPGNARARYALAQALIASDQVALAGEHLERAVELDPRHVDSHLKLGIVRVMQDRATDAIASFERAIELAPDFADPHVGLANALVSLGRLDGAIEHLRWALKLRPRLEEAHVNLANALLETGQVQEAIASYKRALSQNSENAETHFNLGTALSVLGRFAEAETHYRRATELEPQDAEAHHALGLTLINQGKLEDAEYSLGEARRLDPGHIEALNNLGALLARRDRLKEAGELFVEALRIDPDHNDARRNLAGLMAELDFRLAKLLLSEGMAAEAAARLRESLENDPRHTASLRHLVWLLATHPEAEIRNGGEAVRLAESLVDIVAHQGWVYDLLGVAYAESGRFDRAIAAAEEALRLAMPADTRQIAAYRARLEAFRAGRPHREAPTVTRDEP